MVLKMSTNKQTNSNNQNRNIPNTKPTVFVTGMEFFGTVNKVAVIRFLDTFNDDEIIASVALDKQSLEELKNNISVFIESINNE